MKMTLPLARRAATALLLLGPLAGCGKPNSIGDETQILVAADQAIWDALEPEIRAALQPTTFTVRDERVFEVGHVETMEAGWPNLQVTRQILLIGGPSDPTVAAAIEEVEGEVPSPPAIVQARDVWALNQLVTVLLMPEGEDPASVRPLLPQLGALFLQQFEDFARARMFVTGANEALADSLRQNAGFALVVPQVYRVETPSEGVFIFRNDQPDPSRLIRQVTIASRPGGEVPMTAESAIEWRTQLGQEYVQPPQLTEAAPTFDGLQVNTRPAIQIQGVWSNPPDGFPAAGPFITRLIECPGRTFIADAWLYAPAVGKYEYLYQLETILDSFECG